MALKTNKCCCCGPCEVPADCCDCACRWMCFELTGHGDCGCDFSRAEAEWDPETRTWSAHLDCGVEAEVYFVRDEYGQCALALRSECLGYPEGYELLTPITCGDPEDFDVTFSGLDASECGDTYCDKVDLRVRCSERFSLTDPCVCNCLARW